MLRKKLGKDIKQTKPANNPTGQKPIAINLGKEITIDKEKISQIAIAKERQQKKEKELRNKLSQGQTIKPDKHYFTEFSGLTTKKHHLNWEFKLKSKEEVFDQKNYL